MAYGSKRPLSTATSMDAGQVQPFTLMWDDAQLSDTAPHSEGSFSPVCASQYEQTSSMVTKYRQAGRGPPLCRQHPHPVVRSNNCGETRVLNSLWGYLVRSNLGELLDAGEARKDCSSLPAGSPQKVLVSIAPFFSEHAEDRAAGRSLDAALQCVGAGVWEGTAGCRAGAL